MSESTPLRPSLGATYLALVRPLCHAATRQQRVGARLVALTMGLLLVSGRTMLTRVLVVLGRDQCDWSAAYRLFTQHRVDLEVLRRGVVARWLALAADHGPLVTALDGTQLPRTSRRMPGTGFLRAPRTPVWRPGMHYAQRWEGLSGLTPISPAGDCRAIPLWFEPAPPPKAQPWPGIEARPEWEAGLAAIRWLREVLDGMGAARRQLVVVGDGAYSGARFWKGLPPRVTGLARCARNRALYALPDAPTGGRGRRRQYGARGPAPQALLHQRSGWHRCTILVRGRPRHLRVKVTGPWLVKPAPACPLVLIVVAGRKQRQDGRMIRREPLSFLVSARQTPQGAWVAPYPVTDLVRWAWQRWEVEVMHRELKSGWGLGDQQQWHPVSAALVPQWVVWAYAMLALAAHEGWGHAPSPTSSRWYRGRRWTPRDAMTALRQELWQQTLPTFLAEDGGVPDTSIEKRRQALPDLAWLRTAHAL